MFSFSQDFLLYRDLSELTVTLTALCSPSLVRLLQFTGKISCLGKEDFLEKFEVFDSFPRAFMSELLVDIPQLQRLEKPETIFTHPWCCVNWKETVGRESPGSGNAASWGHSTVKVQTPPWRCSEDVRDAIQKHHSGQDEHGVITWKEKWKCGFR